jgi:ABC-type lipoprotein export system ATPase subunit
MNKAGRQQTAANYLKSFGGDLEAAIEELRLAAASKKAETNRKLVDPNSPVVIKAEDLSKTYKLGSEVIKALDDVNFEVRQGEFITITGESGSGKSTLLQLIGGLDKPSSGRITVDGHDIKSLSDRKLSEFRNKSIGFVFQFFYLQPFLNTQTNLELPGLFARTPKAQRAAAAVELAGAVGLAERLKHLPKELSGGQMQRAAIARALLNRPKILLADEPTGNLDQANSGAIIDLFEAVRQKYGTTIVIVTHDRAIAARSDREIKLKDGKVASV